MKPKGTRLSREQLKFEGKLSGLPAKEYYGLKQLDVPKAFARSAKFLNRDLWKKFDRFKPITDAQSAKVHHAINRALLDNLPTYPYTTPTITLNHTTTRKSGKKIWGIQSIRVITVRPTPTNEGSVYRPLTRRKFAIDGKVGWIGYSSHAIDRLLERVPEILEYAHHTNALVTLRILARISNNQHAIEHGRTWMLEAKFEDCHLGYFPITYHEQHKLWVCRTFLLAGMDGTPNNPGKPLGAETLLRVCPEMSKSEWG